MESDGQRLWTTAISKIITKCYILDVTAVLDPPLMDKFMESFFWENIITFLNLGVESSIFRNIWKPFFEKYKFF